MAEDEVRAIWQRRAAFAEYAEAIGTTSDLILAALDGPTATVIYSDATCVRYYAARLFRDRDGILTRETADVEVTDPFAYAARLAGDGD